MQDYSTMMITEVTEKECQPSGSPMQDLDNYRKIPKISPGAYIFQTPFLRGLFLEGLKFGEVFIRREVRVT